MQSSGAPGRVHRAVLDVSLRPNTNEDVATRLRPLCECGVQLAHIVPSCRTCPADHPRARHALFNDARQNTTPPAPYVRPASAPPSSPARPAIRTRVPARAPPPIWCSCAPGTGGSARLSLPAHASRSGSEHQADDCGGRAQIARPCITSRTPRLRPRGILPSRSPALRRVRPWRPSRAAARIPGVDVVPPVRPRGRVVQPRFESLSLSIAPRTPRMSVLWSRSSSGRTLARRLFCVREAKGLYITPGTWRPRARYRRAGC